jgi:hypothetical protein
MALARLALALAAFALLAQAAAAAPRSVSTFHSIGLYWSPPGGAPDNAARVQFRAAGAPGWRQGLDLWFDERDGEYRGSLVELEPDTEYSVRLTLASGLSETLTARTWSERFRVKRTVVLKPGTTRLVIEERDSGSERDGYAVFTGAPGRNTIDQSELTGDEAGDSCVVVKQGVHHVIVRGLVLKNCRRHGVYLERQYDPVLDTTTRDIVIEDNVISGWGGTGHEAPGVVDDDGAIHCNYFREESAAKKPTRIIVQRNRFFNPRYGANPWQSAGEAAKHPHGPQAAMFIRCGTNQVFRYNEIGSSNGNHYNDGIGGLDNFSTEGFPWADSDIYGNRISQVNDDGIESEGGNRNVRIWGNYFDNVFVAVANAATSVGPLYVWRNVANRMANAHEPDGDSDYELRGPFIKAGSYDPKVNGGRAFYFHNTALQPPAPRGRSFSLGAGAGIEKSGGTLYNFVSRNNIWQIHNAVQVDGRAKFFSIRADCSAGPCDADYDLHNGRIVSAGAGAEKHGWGPGEPGVPVYASSGRAYPDVGGRPGDFSLKPGSPGYGAAAPIPNFNDRFARPDVGAQQSGTPPMAFGIEAARRHD